jgi:hypothetical protein
MGLDLNVRRQLAQASDLVLDITPRACIQGDAKDLEKFDISSLDETLGKLAQPRLLRIEEPPRRSLNNVFANLTFALSKSSLCKDADLVLTLGADGANFVMEGGRVKGQFHASWQEMKSVELTGRSAGWFISAARLWIAADLDRHLFFSVYEDDGIEVSVIGWTTGESSSDDLLESLDIQRIRNKLAAWLDMDVKKVIVKATTRSLSDHPNVYAAFLRAREEAEFEPLIEAEPSSNQNIDGAHFLKAMAESSDSLLRVGTAAKLIRMRRREIEVYIISAETPTQRFSNGALVQSWKEDLAIVLPPKASRRIFLNKAVLLGLAHSVSGVPLLYDVVERDITEDLTWIDDKIKANIVIHEFAQSVAVLEDAIQIHETGSHIDLDAIVGHLSHARRFIKAGDWASARKLLRGKVKDDLRTVVRVVREEKKKCCKKTLTYSSTYSPAERKKTFFKYVYVLVMGSTLLGGGSFYFLRRNLAHPSLQAPRLFGRIHVD